MREVEVMKDMKYHVNVLQVGRLALDLISVDVRNVYGAFSARCGICREGNASN